MYPSPSAYLLHSNCVPVLLCMVLAVGLHRWLCAVALQAVNTASVAGRLSGLWLKVRPMNHKKVSEGALTPSLRLVSVWFQAGPRRQ